jgi:hypothetical protein
MQGRSDPGYIHGRTDVKSRRGDIWKRRKPLLIDERSKCSSNKLSNPRTGTSQDVKVRFSRHRNCMRGGPCAQKYTLAKYCWSSDEYSALPASISRSLVLTISSHICHLELQPSSLHLVYPDQTTERPPREARTITTASFLGVKHWPLPFP